MPAAVLAVHPLLTFAFNSLQVSFSLDVVIEVMTELVSQYQVSYILLYCIGAIN
jgi:transportin-3